MANDFIIRNGFISRDNSTVLGSLSATTYLGDGSNLTGIVSTDFSGGTISLATNFQSRVTGIVVPLVQGLTTSTDLSLGNEFSITLTGSTTLSNPINPINGQLFKYVIKQDGVGGHNISFDSKFRFGTEIGPPSIDSNPNKVSFIGVRYDLTDDKFDIIAFVSGY